MCPVGRRSQVALSSYNFDTMMNHLFARMKTAARYLALGLVFQFAVSESCQAASLKTKNVFLITTDGLRWQEVFSGADELLLNKTNGGVVNVDKLRRDFWRDTPEARRAALLPFLWGEIAVSGQIFGNQSKGSIARITNGRKFSYPGYTEFLAGVGDFSIDSNAKRPNKHTNVFEWLNTRPGLRSRVAAVVNWDVIPWILNVERSKLPCWTGMPLPDKAPKVKMVSDELEKVLRDTTPLWPDMILDSFTVRAAVDYVKSKKPRALYIAFAETDQWAHEGRYDHYLRSAHHVDRFIRELWETAQSIPQYRGRTTFIITTDHGRGSGATAWRDHGEKIAGAEDIWVAVIGPDTQALGERANCGAIELRQVPASIAALLGEDFRSCVSAAAPPISDIVRQR